MEDLPEGQMTDATLRVRFGDLIEEAAQAFTIDTNYATEILNKAHSIRERKVKKSVDSI